MVLLAPMVACRPDATPPAPSAEPLRATPASAPPASPSASANSPAPVRTHEPGTVPALPVRKQAAAAAPAAAPTFTRLPAAKSRKPREKIDQVSFAGKGTLVALSSASGIEFVDAVTGAGFMVNQASVEAFAFSADESLLAVSAGGQVTLWDVAKGAVRHTWPGGGANLVFSADGTKLARAGESLLAVHDTATGKEIMRSTPDFNPFGLAFGANGKELVVTGNNIQVAVLSLDTGSPLPGGGGADTGATFGIALSPDGRWAAAGSPAGHGMEVFDVHAWAPRRIVVVPEGACREHVSPAFSPNGKFVFAYGGQRWIKGFEAGSWKPYASYHAPPGRDIASAAADLSRVVVTREDGRGAVVVNVSNNAETSLERAFEDSPAYAMSADGLHVAGIAGGAARLWSARTGKVEYEEQP
ncbi:MAG: hypothetical protein QM820_28690 [Minicystis sp.]